MEAEILRELQEHTEVLRTIMGIGIASLVINVAFIFVSVGVSIASIGGR